jgi:formylmethanofuran dehydrogenase subunit E
MAMAGLRELGIENPRGSEGRDLVIFVEIDRCATDAIISVTGRTPGKRSIKMMDYGKMAATFVDTRPGGAAVRVSVRGDSTETIQQIAQTYMRQKDEKQANIAALIAIPERDLLRIQKVDVTLSPHDLPGEPLDTVVCSKCGEIVKDVRHVVLEGKVLCRPCAQGRDYYTVRNDSLPALGLEGFIESTRRNSNEPAVHRVE